MLFGVTGVTGPAPAGPVTGPLSNLTDGLSQALLPRNKIPKPGKPEKTDPETQTTRTKPDKPGTLQFRF